MEQLGRISWSSRDADQPLEDINSVPEALRHLKVIVELLQSCKRPDTVLSHIDCAVRNATERTPLSQQTPNGPTADNLEKEDERTSIEMKNKSSQDLTEFVHQHRAQLVVRCPNCSSEHRCKYMRPGRNGYVCSHCWSMFSVNTAMNFTVPVTETREYVNSFLRPSCEATQLDLEESRLENTEEDSSDIQGNEDERVIAEIYSKSCQNPTESQLVVSCPNCAAEHKCKIVRPGKNGYVCTHCKSMFLVDKSLDEFDQNVSVHPLETTQPCLENVRSEKHAEGGSVSKTSQHTSQPEMSICSQPLALSNTKLLTKISVAQKETTLAEQNHVKVCYNQIATSTTGSADIECQSVNSQQSPELESSIPFHPSSLLNINLPTQTSLTPRQTTLAEDNQVDEYYSQISTSTTYNTEDNSKLTNSQESTEPEISLYSPPSALSNTKLLTQVSVAQKETTSAEHNHVEECYNQISTNITGSADSNSKLMNSQQSSYVETSIPFQPLTLLSMKLPTQTYVTPRQTTLAEDNQVEECYSQISTSTTYNTEANRKLTNSQQSTEPEISLYFQPSALSNTKLQTQVSVTQKETTSAEHNHVEECYNQISTNTTGSADSNSKLMNSQQSSDVETSVPFQPLTLSSVNLPTQTFVTPRQTTPAEDNQVEEYYTQLPTSPAYYTEGNSQLTNSQQTTEPEISLDSQPSALSSMNLPAHTSVMQMEITPTIEKQVEECDTPISTNATKTIESQKYVKGGGYASQEILLACPTQPKPISAPYYSKLLVNVARESVPTASLSTQTSFFLDKDLVTGSSGTMSCFETWQSAQLQQCSSRLNNVSSPISSSSVQAVAFNELCDSCLDPVTTAGFIPNQSSGSSTKQDLFRTKSRASTELNINKQINSVEECKTRVVKTPSEILINHCHQADRLHCLPQPASKNFTETLSSVRERTILTPVSFASDVCSTCDTRPVPYSETKTVKHESLTHLKSLVASVASSNNLSTVSLQETSVCSGTDRHSKQSKVFSKGSNNSSNITSPASCSAECQQKSCNLSSTEKKKNLSSSKKKKKKISNDSDMTTAEDLKKFLREFKLKRAELQLSQGAVCATLSRLYGSGFEQSTLSRFESGQLNFRSMLKKKRQIAEVLKVIENGSKETDLDDLELPPVKKRRSRAVLAGKLDNLEEYYSRNRRPSSCEINAIAEELALKKDVVRVWFCNRRAKERMELASGTPP